MLLNIDFRNRKSSQIVDYAENGHHYIYVRLYLQFVYVYWCPTYIVLCSVLFVFLL